MALYHLLTSQVAEVRTTEGSSMLPTLAAQGDRVLQVRLPLYRASLEWRERVRRLFGGEQEEGQTMREEIAKKKSRNPLGLQLGDLVVAVSPVNPSRPVCKRIVGLPGDEVRVDPRKEYGPMITVPKGHAFLTGDNLGNSTDSRHYGPVPLGLIKGVVVARVSTCNEIDLMAETYV